MDQGRLFVPSLRVDGRDRDRGLQCLDGIHRDNCQGGGKQEAYYWIIMRSHVGPMLASSQQSWEPIAGSSANPWPKSEHRTIMATSTSPIFCTTHEDLAHRNSTCVFAGDAIRVSG
jgi:hypothetical protein